MQDTFTLADLVKVSGAKRRSLQLWADAGVIQALPQTERAGTGVHRLFSRDEAVIACLVHPFASHQMAIGELLIISRLIRAQLTIGRLEKADFITPSIGGEGDTLLVYETFFMGGSLQRGIRIDIGSDVRFASRRHPESICMVIRLETYLAKLG